MHKVTKKTSIFALHDQPHFSYGVKLGTSATGSGAKNQESLNSLWITINSG